jgi:uncharacterized protein (TIGR00251 family)
MPPHTTRLTLRVSPGAARSEVVGRHGDGWKLRVVAAPERGRANASVVELLAESLHLSRPDVRIVGGASSRDKTVELVGLSLPEVERLLAAAQKGCP